MQQPQPSSPSGERPTIPPPPLPLSSAQPSAPQPAPPPPIPLTAESLRLQRDYLVIDERKRHASARIADVQARLERIPAKALVLQERMLAVVTRGTPESRAPQVQKPALQQLRPAPPPPPDNAALNRASARLSTLRLAVHDPLLLRLEGEAAESTARLMAADFAEAQHAVTVAMAEEAHAPADALAIIRGDEVMQGIATAAAASLAAARLSTETEARRCAQTLSELCHASEARVSDSTFVIEADFQAEMTRLQAQHMELRVATEVRAAWDRGTNALE